MRRIIDRFIAIAAASACVLALVGGVGAQPRAHAVARPVIPVAVIEERSSTVGIAEGADLYFMSEADIARSLDAMQSLGVQDVRIAIFWADVEAEEGVFDWTRVDRMVEAAHDRGMGILGTMLYTPDWAGAGLTSHPDPVKWGAFVGQAAERYAGRISAYEIWNEPTTTLFWDPADPVGYTDLLKAGYQAIKDADSSAMVIAGSVVAGPSRPDGSTMSPVDFLQGMYDAGAQGYFDAISYHPYLFSMPFSGGQGQPHFDYPIEQLDAMRALMIEHGDGDLKVWITEYGQATTTLADGSVLTEEQQAAFITDLLRTWQSVQGAGPVFLYNLRDTQTGHANPDNNLGLYQSDWTEKQAAAVLAALIKELNPAPGQGNPVVLLVKRIVRAIGEAIMFVPNLIGRVVRTVVKVVGDVLGVKSARVAAVPAAGAAADPVDVQAAVPERAAVTVADERPAFAAEHAGPVAAQLVVERPAAEQPVAEQRAEPARAETSVAEPGDVDVEREDVVVVTDGDGVAATGMAGGDPDADAEATEAESTETSDLERTERDQDERAGRSNLDGRADQKTAGRDADAAESVPADAADAKSSGAAEKKPSGAAGNTSSGPENE